MNETNTDVSGKHNIRRVSFEGVPAGDSECFCWNVSELTFRSVARREPEDHDRAYDPETGDRLDDQFRLYPGAVLRGAGLTKPRRGYYTIEVIEDAPDAD